MLTGGTDNTGNGGDTPAPTPQNSPDLSNENNSYQQNLVDSINAQNQAYNDYKSQIQNIMNGTFPLTGAQKALVDSTSQAFDGMVREANLRGAALSSETGGFSNKVTQALGEISNIDSAKAAAIAKLELGFQDQNYKLVTDSYKAYTDAETKKTDLLTKLHEDVVSQANIIRKANEDQRNYNLDVAKFDELTKQNTKSADLEERKFNETKAKDLFDQHYKEEQLKMQNAGMIDANGNLVQHPIVTTDPNGKVNAASQEAFLASLPPMTATTVRSLIDYTGNPTNLSTRSIGGGQSQRQIMMALAHQADPTFDESQYGARSKFNTSWTGGGLASSNNAINTAMQHLDELQKAATGLKNAVAGGVFTKKYNSVANYIADNEGKPEVKQYELAANLVASEMAKAYKNGINSNAAPSGEEISEQRKILDNSVTPEQADGVISTAVNLLNDKVTVNSDQYFQTMGRTAPRILLPSTVDKLNNMKDKGLNLNVQGLYFTDPVAYASASPENAKTFSTFKAQFPTYNPTQLMQLINAQNQ